MWKRNIDFYVYEIIHVHEILLFIIEVNKLEEQYNKIVIPNEENVVIYYKIRQQLAKLGKEIEEYIHKPKYCLPFLQPGRLVKVNEDFFLLLFGFVSATAFLWRLPCSFVFFSLLSLKVLCILLTVFTFITCLSVKQSAMKAK